MTPDQERQYQDLKLRAGMLAERLQRIANVLADAAFMRAMGLASPRDETAWMKDYDETLRRIDEITQEEEALLRKAGILNTPEERHIGRVSP
jgi:hypothetical protein